MRFSALITGLVLTAGCSGFAAAVESPWSVKLGMSQVKPKSQSGITGIDVSSEMGITPAIEYRFSPNLVGEVLLALPIKHDVRLQGWGKIATIEELPPTFTLKYDFTPDKDLKPYVGLGLNYTMITSEEITQIGYGALGAGSTLKADDSFGLALTAGAEWRPAGSQWGLALDVRYIGIRSDVTVSGNKLGSLKIDPLVTGVSAVYHY